MEKIAIFVEVQNIYYTVSDGLHDHFDYNYFWAKTVQDNCEVIEAFAYAINLNGAPAIKNEDPVNFNYFFFATRYLC